MDYQIRMVAQMLGIPKNTLIAWERRYSIIAPSRTESGYRLYSEDDVRRLRRVKDMIDAGHRVGDACRMLEAELEQRPAPAPELSDGDAAIDRVREALKAALLAFDRDAADRASVRLLMVPYEQVLRQVYVPLLYEIGDGWERGEVSVVQEHFASAYCREKVLVMRHSLGTPSPRAPEIVCATPPGEIHEIGLLSLALALTMRGFRVTYLGANVPTAGLVNYVETVRPAGVCLSLVLGRPAADIERYAAEIRRRLPGEVSIAIGGRAVAVLGEALAEVAGVDFVVEGLPSWLQEATASVVARSRG
jgi:DNA-binding transcriptional MerR regulator/methylmalonyl-CoA mutase cobalamin-binding subunit